MRPVATINPNQIGAIVGVFLRGAVGDSPDVVGFGVAVQLSRCPFDSTTAVIPFLSGVSMIDP